MIKNFLLGIFLPPILWLLVFQVCSFLCWVFSSFEIIIVFISFMFVNGIAVVCVLQIIKSWKQNKAFSVGLITSFGLTICFIIYILVQMMSMPIH